MPLRFAFGNRLVGGKVFVFFNRAFIKRWNLTPLSDCHDLFYKLAVDLRASGG